MSGRCSCVSKKHVFASKSTLGCAEIARSRSESKRRLVHDEPKYKFPVLRRLAACMFFQKGCIVRGIFGAWNDKGRCQKESSGHFGESGNIGVLLGIRGEVEFRPALM